MEIVDPSVRRRQQRDRQVGNPAALRMGVIWFVLGTAGAFVLGLLVSLWFDALRAISLNAPSGTHVSGVSVPLVVAGVGAGALLVGLGLPVGAHHLDGYRAARGGGGWALAIGVAGFALGVAVAARDWVAADRVGWVVTDYEPPEPWGWGRWILYYADLWLPGLLVVLSLLLVWSAVRAERRGAASAATRDRLLIEGLRTTGTISELRIHYSSDDSGGRHVAGATATVTYVDAAGTRRWVTRKYADASVLVQGGEVQVLHDPAHPDDDDSVFVSFLREPAGLDWV
ncbi:hypothetical protein OIC43_43490 [Streptomyces sp. NBC_00825]|uniref:DUF3592 domain-containing protein n=1 Tax=unclassified Streptomyces TaxID=2593676 RepID=UPI00224FEDE8|nr:MULTISPECIES: DUF3592 domain-containing protein [unclassified Streptomyces]WTB51749.1 hypothetical protein OG832_00190 [Streptomyces sp. NBC_00826]WTH95359.1 hypothetical protein OIC43_43490 [Streptomyces sp. NBC_00825]WTI04093.1 hypothetical protein OHA23_43465 [Streptomyces sp. NBC_00822]MCX4869694.1 hypothetical protein [Streptomyces sp. NBC_00906]MCX4902649.1 hypothetical protein [Streptomyces sp. NBC_00892]